MPLAGTLHGHAPKKPPKTPQLHFVNSKLKIDSENRTFRPGDAIFGAFEVISLPRIATPEIYGLILQLDGVMQVKDILKDTREKKVIFRHRTYFYGGGEAKPVPLKKGEYKFAFNVPDDCPSTFIGGIGRLRFNLKCIANHSTEGYYGFAPEEVIIVTKTVSEWKNHEYYLDPMFANAKVSSFIFSGEIHIWLKTNRKCYQPGGKIKFTVKVKNEGVKNVKSMKIQLRQAVEYNFESIKQDERILLPALLNGPGVHAESVRIWNGELIVPSEIPPSIVDYTIHSPISFQYHLLVTLQMAGNLVPNHVEKFPIQIGFPLESSREETEEDEEKLNFGGKSPARSPRRSPCHQKGSSAAHLSQGLYAGMRRMSLATLAATDEHFHPPELGGVKSIASVLPIQIPFSVSSQEFRSKGHLGTLAE